LLHAQLLICI